MNYSEVLYEGLDQQGYPLVRQAKVIGELPTPEMRSEACAEATAAIGARLGLRVVRMIPFGEPVYKAFGMTHPDAKNHREHILLLTRGCDVSLDLCQ